MTFNRDIFRRILSVAAALAFAVGCVLLMRLVAREIVGANGRRTFTAEAGARIEPASNVPKVYDLQKLVGGEAGFTLLGRTGLRTSENVLQPVAVTVAEQNAQLVAEGWEPFESPFRGMHSLADKLNDVHYFKNADGRICCRRYAPLKGGVTHVLTMTLPEFADFKTLSAETGADASVTGLASVKATALLAKMPPVLREVLVGLPVFTTLVPHEGGHAYLVLAVAELPVAVAERRFRAGAARTGWRQYDKKHHVWYNENLTLVVRFETDVAQPGVAVVSYRISDDEVRINRITEQTNEN